MNAPNDVPRDFIPGKCGPEGTAARIFLESDTKPSPAALMLAKDACLDCIQLRYCREQSQDIARTLHGNNIKAAVVGGLVIAAPPDIRYLTQRERLALEPKFQFDTSVELPTDPKVAAAVLRQWARINNKALTGKTSAIAVWARDMIMDDPAFKEKVAEIELAGEEVDAVLYALAKQLVAYARKDASHNTWARRPPERQLDITAFGRVAPLYLADAEKIKTLGLPHARLALYYGAEFWQRLLGAYEVSQCVTSLEVKDCCEKRPRDPTSMIERFIERSRLRRAGEYDNPFKIPEEIRIAEAERLEEELADTHPYITRAMINKALRSSSLKSAYKKIERLKQPQVAEVAYEFRNKINKEALQYCLMYSADPRQAVNDYLQRLEDLRGWINAGYNVIASDIEAFALRSMHGMTREEIVQAIEAAQLRRDFGQGYKKLGGRSNLPGWIFEKIVCHFDSEEWWRVAGNLAQLIEMDILRIDHLTCELESEAADHGDFLRHAVGKKGAYITFAPEAYDRYDSHYLMYLVKAAKLDLLVYGQRLPENPDEDIDPPLFLKLEQMAEFEEQIRKSAKALRILNGELPVPKEILVHLGWPVNQEAKKAAFAAIRNSVLRTRRVKQAYDRARVRENHRNKQGD